jgi:hypothetical protein
LLNNRHGVALAYAVREKTALPSPFFAQKADLEGEMKMVLHESAAAVVAGGTPRAA